MAGAVGVAGVGEPAAVFGAVMVMAFAVDVGVGGVAAVGLSGVVGVDVVELAAVGGVVAAGGAAGAVAGDEELFEGFGWFVAGGP